MLTYSNMCWKKERSKVTVTFDELCVISFRWIKSTMCKSRSPRGNCFSLQAIETQGVNLHCFMGPLSWGFSKLPWVYTETQTHEISLNITKFQIGRFPKRFPRSWQFLLVFSSFFVRSSFLSQICQWLLMQRADPDAKARDEARRLSRNPVERQVSVTFQHLSTCFDNRKKHRKK